MKDKDDITGEEQFIGILVAFLVFAPIIWVIWVLIDLIIYGLIK